MTTRFTQEHFTAMIEKLFAENNADVVGIEYDVSFQNSEAFLGAVVHHDGDFDIEAALKPKPSPASDALAIKVDVLQAKIDVLFAALTNILGGVDNACATFLPIRSFKSQRDQARAALEASKS